jgi:hypothetical protein
MNITDQFQQIGVLLTDNRFVTILKQMAAPVVFQIISDGMTRQKAAHKLRNPQGTTEYQEMDVIIHQGPSQYFRSSHLHQLTDTRDKILPVLVVKEYRAAFNSSHHHMVKYPRCV